MTFSVQRTGLATQVLTAFRCSGKRWPGPTSSMLRAPTYYPGGASVLEPKEECPRNRAARGGWTRLLAKVARRHGLTLQQVVTWRTGGSRARKGEGCGVICARGRDRPTS